MMKSDSVIAAGLAGGVGVLCVALLVFITKVIYDDGEFSGPGFMASNTAMVLLGSVVALAAALLHSKLKAGQRASLLTFAAVLFLGALGPGVAFSYVGLPGFGGWFFLAFILFLNLLLATVSLIGAVLLLRGKEG
jgi:hypothetical protein